MKAWASFSSFKIWWKGIVRILPSALRPLSLRKEREVSRSGVYLEIRFPSCPECREWIESRALFASERRALRLSSTQSLPKNMVRTTSPFPLYSW